LRSFLASNGMILRLTCPYTSQQNGRVERVLRTLNDSVRALMSHAAVLATFWPQALAMATHVLNRRPCRPRHDDTPYQLLYGCTPSYDHLRVFGCLCYPNITATAPNKLSPRSIACIFLGYPVHTKGYRCFDPKTNHVIVSRHVYFDEQVFPFCSRAQLCPQPRCRLLMRRCRFTQFHASCRGVLPFHGLPRHACALWRFHPRHQLPPRRPRPHRHPHRQQPITRRCLHRPPRCTTRRHPPHPCTTRRRRQRHMLPAPRHLPRPRHAL
jgi:hypothetical protein